MIPMIILYLDGLALHGWQPHERRHSVEFYNSLT